MSAMEAFWAAPPVTRTLTAAALGLSIAVHYGPLNGYYVVWLWYRVFTLRAVPEIWRAVTSFLLTGRGLNMIFDTFFLYQYSSQLEVGSQQFGEPGSFLTYILFIAVFVLITNGCFLGGVSFLHCLVLAFAYTSAQDDPNRRASFIIVTFAAKYLPLAMLLVTFLTAGPDATIQQTTGLLAAHLYHFLVKLWPEHGGGNEVIKTPALIRRIFEQPGDVRQRSYGTAMGARSEPVGQNQTGRSGAWSSGASTAGNAARSVWASRGPGQRLGGD